MPNSPLKTVADLKGKKFGISNPKSLGEMMGVLVMEKAGLKPDDVQSVALGSLGGALTALENGVVDATAMPVILFRRAAARASIASWSGRRNCRYSARSSAWPPAS